MNRTLWGLGLVVAWLLASVPAQAETVIYVSPTVGIWRWDRGAYPDLHLELIECVSDRSHDRLSLGGSSPGSVDARNVAIRSVAAVDDGSSAKDALADDDDIEAI